MENETQNAGGVVFQKGTRIMVVEDDKFFSQLLSKKLGDAGAEIIYAASGEDALLTLQKEARPTIILLDILLPGIDGFEVLRKIKGNDALKNIPVVFLSNFGSEEQIKMGRKLGVDNYLIKATVTPAEILKEIQAVLARNNK